MKIERRRLASIEKVREYRARLQALKNHPCTDCAVSYPPYVMQWDHVRGEKKFNIASAMKSPKKWGVILDEIAKCDLVCANCHAERTNSRWRGVVRATTPRC